jgi:hypothetical protein
MNPRADGFRHPPQSNTETEEGSMEEAKRKEIEAKLHKLFAEADQSKNQKSASPKNTPSGARVIRRRKGKPDLKVA